MSRFNKERMSIRSTVLQNQYAFFEQWQCHEQPVMSCNCLGRWGFSGGQWGGLGREGMPPIKHKFELTHYNILINSQKFKICSKLNFLFLIKNYKYLSFKKCVLNIFILPCRTTAILLCMQGYKLWCKQECRMT